MATLENRPSQKKHDLLLGDIKSELKKPDAKNMIQAFSDYVELRDAEVQLFKRTENLTINMDLGSKHSRRVGEADLLIDQHIKDDPEVYAESYTIMSGLVGRYIGTYRGVSLSKDNPTREEQALDKLKAIRDEFSQSKNS